MRHAWNEAHVQPPVTPINILIMLLLLLQRIQNGVAAAFWGIHSRSTYDSIIRMG